MKNKRRRAYGSLYCLTHPRFPGMIKVGKSRNLRARLQRYNSVFPAEPVHLLASCASSAIDEDEVELIERMRRRFERVQGKREWFWCDDPDTVSQLMERITGNVEVEFVTDKEVRETLYFLEEDHVKFYVVKVESRKFIQCSYFDRDGKKKWKSTGTTDMKEAELFAARLEGELSKSQPPKTGERGSHRSISTCLSSA